MTSWLTLLRHLYTNTHMSAWFPVSIYGASHFILCECECAAAIIRYCLCTSTAPTKIYKCNTKLLINMWQDGMKRQDKKLDLTTRCVAFDVFVWPRFLLPHNFRGRLNWMVKLLFQPTHTPKCIKREWNGQVPQKKQQIFINHQKWKENNERRKSYTTLIISITHWLQKLCFIRSKFHVQERTEFHLLLDIDKRIPNAVTMSFYILIFKWTLNFWFNWNLQFSNQDIKMENRKQKKN